jgi:hypothetical protein
MTGSAEELRLFDSLLLQSREQDEDGIIGEL